MGCAALDALLQWLWLSRIFCLYITKPPPIATCSGTLTKSPFGCEWFSSIPLSLLGILGGTSYLSLCSIYALIVELDSSTIHLWERFQKLQRLVNRRGEQAAMHAHMPQLVVTPKLKFSAFSRMLSDLSGVLACETPAETPRLGLHQLLGLMAILTLFMAMHTELLVCAKLCTMSTFSFVGRSLHSSEMKSFSLSSCDMPFIPGHPLKKSPSVYLHFRSMQLKVQWRALALMSDLSATSNHLGLHANYSLFPFAMKCGLSEKGYR